ESYEHAAYYYARRSKLACLDRGEKGYIFFLGDEGFYPRVRVAQIKQILGHEPDEAIGYEERGQEFPGATELDSAAIFRELQQRFHTF
ncbi:hypothetical protein, partial [Salmonella sp. SAL4448]|uniref:hypothetical protein n=1 Tax=Salmonella sp. SAL4448 TaxID=3159903 RepID=UPI00397AB855